MNARKDGGQPTLEAEIRDGELGAWCPHCEERWLGLGSDDPDEIETHPALPNDRSQMLCRDCNKGFMLEF